MTEIKTTTAWGWLRPNGKLVDAWVETETIGDPQNAPVVIVHGQTEAEVHDAAALRSACRELCIETVEQLKARLAPDPRVAVLEKKLAKLTDKLAMVEQESEQRLSAIIGYSDQLLAMKEKYEPVPQNEPHPDGCFSSDPNDVTDCESDWHYSCKDCKRNSRIADQRGEG